MRKAWDRLFKWLFSLLLVVGLPSVPIALEYVRTGHVQQDTYFVISIILSGTYLCGAEVYFYKFVYILLLIINGLLDVVPQSSSTGELTHHGGALLIAVALLHGTERFGWHVVQDRPFPDSLRNNNG